MLAGAIRISARLSEGRLQAPIQSKASRQVLGVGANYATGPIDDPNLAPCGSSIAIPPSCGSSRRPILPEGTPMALGPGHL